MTDRERRAILARNPNKKVRKGLNEAGRINDLNGFTCGHGSHKSSRKDGERRRRKMEDRQFTRQYA